ncbi:acyl-CoA dehydrogenase family protein [Cryptosporangium sp. NPDC051539]|uniref:acyl-CoA dehydrogenase family protein n=1 Tax=Cryptosporangium sp. NPDC051539 TaxID=3363962 RepID=UPI003797AE2E
MGLIGVPTTTGILPPLWPDADPSVLVPIPEHDDLRSVTRAMLAGHAAAPDLWDLLTAELAVAGMAVPERLGGSGYGLREVAVVLEEAGAALVSHPILSGAVLGAQALVLSGSADDLLPDVLRGEHLVTVWFGSGTAPVATEADGAWTVSGLADRVLDGARARHVVVPVGTALFLVDVQPGTVRPRRVVDETRPQADVVFDAAPARVLVAGSRSAVVLARLRTLRDVAVAAEHAGIVGHLLDLTVGYVRTREQFGRPIGSFQAIKHRLADVLVDRERCLSAARFAAAAYDADPDGAGVPAAVAAAVCGDALMRTAHETVQLHGGVGFTWEHSAHHYLRRALGDEGLFGSAHAHRLRLAELLGF